MVVVNHSNRCGVVSPCFNLHFSDDIWCAAFSHMLIHHLYIFFCNVSVCLGLSPFLKVRLLAFLLLSFKSSLYTLDYSPLFDVFFFCKYFLPVCGLPSHSLNSIFHRAEDL